MVDMPKWGKESNYSEKDENAIDQIWYLMRNTVVGSRKEKDVIPLIIDFLMNSP